MNEIFQNLYEMTAFSNIIAEPQFLIMYAIAFILLYLGIKKQYEPAAARTDRIRRVACQLPRRRYGCDTGRRKRHDQRARSDEEHLGDAAP